MYTLSHPAAIVSEKASGLCITSLAWAFFFQSLLLVLPMLKLLHLGEAANWSWGWVTIPLWGPGVLLALLLLAERATGTRKVENQLALSYVAQ